MIQITALDTVYKLSAYDNFCKKDTLVGNIKKQITSATTEVSEIRMTINKIEELKVNKLSIAVQN